MLMTAMPLRARRKTQERVCADMENKFYIVSPREGWYRLHIKDSHYCLGAGDDLNTLLETLRKTVKRYKRVSRLENALKELEDRGEVNENTQLVYAGEYTLLAHVYEETVKKTVHSALEEIKYDSPLHRNFKKRITLNSESPKITQSSDEEKSELKIHRPRRIFKH